MYLFPEGVVQNVRTVIVEKSQSFSRRMHYPIVNVELYIAVLPIVIIVQCL